MKLKACENRSGWWHLLPAETTLTGEAIAVASVKKEGDARFMVRACECHAPMVAALHRITRDLEYTHGGHGQMPEPEAGYYAQAKAALALAGGGR